MAFSSLFANRSSPNFQTCLAEPEEDDDDGLRDSMSTWSTCPSIDFCESSSDIETFAKPRNCARNFVRPRINVALIHKEIAPLVPQCQRISERFEGMVKLSEGTCAVVYRAVCRKHRIEVALKVVRTEDEEHLQFARDEFKLLQRLSHPKIIKALDFFSLDFGSVVVEELFDGSSLEKVVDEMEYGCLEESVSRKLFIQLLDAIAYLHAQGVIHRDVKPANALVSNNLMDLRLIDFNCSKLLADGGALTMTGTPAYMPPEVLKGNSPSEASDVWAAGLCFHYMLFGRLPSKHASVDMQFEGSRQDFLSGPIKEILRKCLEPRLDRRPQAAEILLLSQLQDH